MSYVNTKPLDGWIYLTSFSSLSRWLRGVTGLLQEEIDEDNPQVTHVLAVLTEQELASFNRNFRDSS